jgi:hypothetical protein
MMEALVCHPLGTNTYQSALSRAECANDIYRHNKSPNAAFKKSTRPRCKSHTYSYSWDRTCDTQSTEKTHISPREKAETPPNRHPNVASYELVPRLLNERRLWVYIRVLALYSLVSSRRWRYDLQVMNGTSSFWRMGKGM